MLNVEVTRTGALITSTGFEVVSSIVGTGGVKSLMTYDKDETDRFLIITHGDHHYSITPTVTTWNDIGDYGTETELHGGTVYVGAAGDRLAVLGNDDATNSTYTWDGAAFTAIADATPKGGYIWTEFQGRLFVAKGSTVFYTNVDDETDWGGGGSIGFNDIVTGLLVEGKRLIVFTRTYHQAIFFDYNDSFNISTPLKEPYERDYGALAYKAISRRQSNIRYWAEDNRHYNLGSEENMDELGLPRSMPLSKNIDPSLNFANKSYRDESVSIYVEGKEQWWHAVPNDVSQINSLIYVYNENWNSYSTRFGFYPSGFAIMRDANYEPELYFSDSLSPTIYKFNDDYSYAGNGYTRSWKSKKFTMSDSSLFKEWKWIDLAGSMYSNTSFIVRIQVDTNYREYLIDNTHLELDAFGEYIGDNFLGDALLGGSEPSEVAFKRFRAHIPVPTPIREGFELQITIYNSDEGEPWKIDEIGIDYEYKARKQRKASFIANNQLP